MDGEKEEGKQLRLRRFLLFEKRDGGRDVKRLPSSDLLLIKRMKTRKKLKKRK